MFQQILRHFVAVILCGFLVGCATVPTTKYANSPLEFADAAETFYRPANLKQTKLFRPTKGEGPYPGVVLLPSCAGVADGDYDWVQRYVTTGYVVLVVDSNTPRGVAANCRLPVAVTLDQIAEDTSAALAHLRSRTFVDGERLGIVGFSWGTMAALRISGASYQRRLSQGAAGLRAIAFFYGSCGTHSSNPESRANTNNLSDDLVTPTMMFLGGLDTEAQPGFCTEKADRLKDRGLPIDFKLYPQATHAFDKSIWGVSGRTVDSGERGKHTYRYDPAATADAWSKTLAFFERELRQAN